MDNENLNEKLLSVPFEDSDIILKIEDIIFCEGDDYKTKIFVKGRTEPIVICRTLKEVELRLSKCGFMRVHKSFIICIMHIKKHDHRASTYAVMVNDKFIPVSKSYREPFSILMHLLEV